uniref:uridine/cytidine kinase n=1 Tax=Cairina moschata TaxID=8855 RepID=A0A8C3BSD5_CAIMO
MQRDLDVLESGADRDLLQLHKESCKAWPLGRNEPSTRTGQGHPAWKQLGTEGPGVPVGTAVRGSQQRALGQRGMEVSWLRWDSRGGILPLCWGALGGPGPSGESPGHEERLLGLEQRRLRRSSPMAVSTRREVRRGRSRALLSVAQGQAQRPRAQPGAAPAGGRAGRGGAGGRGRGAGAAGSRVPAPPRPGSPRGGQMAAAGAEERRGAWGAAGPERGPGPGPGPGPVPLGSLLSRLPLSAPPPRRRTASQCKPEPPLLRTSKRTIYTAGRPPWYSETGAPVDEAFVIGGPRGRAGPGRAGVGGWEGAGTALTVPARPRAVRRQRLGQDDGGDADHRGAGRALGRAALHGLLLQGECGTARCDTAQHGVARHGVTRHSTARRGAERCRCPQVLDEGQQALAARSDYNFDHPDAFDFELLVSVLRKLKKGKSVKVPVYDFTTHSRRREWKTVYGANVIVFEGILAFANKELLKLLDMKVFVDTDSDIRLVRRLQRDIMERGRDIVGVIKQYNKFVKPAFEQYIEPTVQVADIVVPRGGENFVALDLIVQHVHSQLEKREITVRATLASAHQGQPLPKTLSVLENTPQVRGMHTIIRNKDTTRDEFIFYSKRLMRLLIEHALSFLPLKSVTVETPQGTTYEGKRFHRQRITGVSILRAGETMEQALTAVCKDIRLGKILIQTNHDTGEPEDHDVQEDRIFLLSLLMAEMGVHSVAYAFPRVRIITTAVDKRINEEFHIIPGIGNFGDRYFGTDAPPACCESEAMDC